MTTSGAGNSSTRPRPATTTTTYHPQNQRTRSSSLEELWQWSATGERFPKPTKFKTSHPLWKKFLESGSMSPTQFFRAFLAPPSYFHSPTPWRSGSARGNRLAQKVSELLDSFKPGSYSYHPFRDPRSHQRVHRAQRSQGSGSARGQQQGSRRRASRADATSAATSVPSVPVAPQSRDSQGESEEEEEGEFGTDNADESGVASSGGQPDERRRRLLYVNLGRPRPFYRVTADDADDCDGGQAMGRDAPSLQSAVMASLVANYGLEGLRTIVLTNPRLPQMVRDKALTFLCSDFEEVTPSDCLGDVANENRNQLRLPPPHPPPLPTSPSTARPRPLVSYKVRCLHDGRRYRATFATSEVDKLACSFWSEYRQWLTCLSPHLSPILALAVDPVTENLFFITGEDESQEDERLLGMRVPRVFRPTPRLSPECSRLMEMLGIAVEDFLAEDNVSRVSREEGVRFQNPLLVKKVRRRLKWHQEAISEAGLSSLLNSLAALYAPPPPLFSATAVKTQIV